MTESVESRARIAPFLWISSATFKRLTRDVPERKRANVGWVYTCLAGAASDRSDGTHEGFAASPTEVQAMTGLSRSTFRSAIHTLEELGLLYRQLKSDSRGMTIGVRYILLEPGQRGVTKQPHGGLAADANANPTNAGERNGGIKKENPPTPQEREQLVREGKRVLSHRRSKSTKAQTEDVVALFDGYNSEVGRRISMFTGTGKQHPDLTKVLGAVLEFPNVERTTWLRMMHTVLANPWWGDGPPSVGVVFGPGVVSDNLENPARGRRNGHNTTPVVRRKLEELDLG